MHEFKLTVEIPGLPEAINNLAEALRAGQVNALCKQSGGSGHCSDDDIKNVDTGKFKEPTPVAPENPSPAASTAQTPSAPPVNAAASAPAAQSPSEGKSYTLDDLSRAGAALIDQGKMTQLCDLLGKYGVQAVTQLPAESYPAFVADLKALGAAL